MWVYGDEINKCPSCGSKNCNGVDEMHPENYNCNECNEFNGILKDNGDYW
jgi:hypothetical protein